MSLIERVINNLEERRNNILSGNINSIPSPFKRFRNDFIGIEQGQYVVVTAPTKGSKSQFTNFMYVFTPILYAYHNPDKISLKIIYFTLEENADRIVQRFMSFLLNHLSNGKIRISPRDLRSTDNEKPLSDEIIQLLRSEEYQSILRFFENTVDFISDGCNPTGMYKICRDYALSQGTIINRKVKYGEEEFDKFDSYIPNDLKLYKLVITDHIALVEKERGFTDKQAIDKWSEYEVKYLRNRYGFTCIDIQQQAFEGEGIEAQKLGKIEGSIGSLGDSKYTARNANLVLGLFSPFKFELPQYKGYNITKFKDNIRFLKIYVNRDGEMGGVCPLFFDGAVCQFKELPRPDDGVHLTKVYEYLDTIRNNKPINKIFFNYGERLKADRASNMILSRIVNKLITYYNNLFK